MVIQQGRTVERARAGEKVGLSCMHAGEADGRACTEIRPSNVHMTRHKSESEKSSTGSLLLALPVYSCYPGPM